MDKEARQARKVDVMQALSDAEAIVKKKFPYMSEGKADHRIAVLAITKMLIGVSE